MQRQQILVQSLDISKCRRREKVTTVISDPSPWSTVAHLHLDELSLADKQDGRPADVETFEETRARLLALDLVVVPDLFDRRGKRAMRTASDAYENVNEKALEQTSHPTGVSNTLAGLNNSAAVTNRIGEWLHISEAMARQDGLEVEDEVRACFTELECEFEPSLTGQQSTYVQFTVSTSSCSFGPRRNTLTPLASERIPIIDVYVTLPKDKRSLQLVLWRITAHTRLCVRLATTEPSHQACGHSSYPSGFHFADMSSRTIDVILGTSQHRPVLSSYHSWSGTNFHRRTNSTRTAFAHPRGL